MNYIWTLIVGMFLGAAALSWWNAPTKIIESPAAAARQADGSLVAERTATNPKAKPVHAVPKGGKAERTIRVDVQPERTDCPVCSVDLTLVRMGDDTRRVVASSPTGVVIGALDVPIMPIEVEKHHPWAVGISRATGEESWGVWLDRDIGPLRIGGEANKTGDNNYEARLRFGIRF